MPYKSYIHFFFIVLIILLLGVILYKALDNDPSTIPSPLINQPMPNFELTTLGNPTQKINEKTLLGVPFMLNVWASWCVSCQIEHPIIMALAKNNTIKIIGLNYKDNFNDAIKWLRQLQNPYDLNLYDPTGSVSFNFGVYGAPETFIIDANGIIKYRHTGPITHELVSTELLPLIDQLTDAKN